MTAYTSALFDVSLVGPTLFGRVVTVAADIVAQALIERKQKYCVTNNRGYSWDYFEQIFHNFLMKLMIKVRSLNTSTLGFTLGVFPICGDIVFLSGLVIHLLGSRCHPPTVLLTNFVATPIELRTK